MRILVNEALDLRIKNGTLMHAYIISGSAENEKKKIVAKMAASIVCSGKGSKPCGLCEDCRKASLGIHPDIITILKAADKREILVDQIREITSDAFVLPNDAERKVYIIDGADNMNIRAQNAILKVLEEPPSFVSFILIAENSGALLETIRSRCVDINFHQSSAENYFDSNDRIIKSVVNFFDVFESGTELDLFRTVFEIEKLEKNTFVEFVEKCYIETIERMKKAVKNGSQKPELYADIARVFKECRKYLDFNVGIGHICGMLTASLIELRDKKRGT